MFSAAGLGTRADSGSGSLKCSLSPRSRTLERPRGRASFRRNSSGSALRGAGRAPQPPYLFIVHSRVKRIANKQDTSIKKQGTPSQKIAHTDAVRASAGQRGLSSRVTRSGAYRHTCRAALTDRHSLPASSEARRLPQHPTSACCTEFLLRLAAAAAAVAAQAWQPTASVCASLSPPARGSSACAGLHRGCSSAS